MCVSLLQRNECSAHLAAAWLLAPHAPLTPPPPLSPLFLPTPLPHPTDRKRATKVVKKLQAELAAVREEALLAAEEREEERSQLLSEVEAKQMALEGAELKAMASSSSIRSARAQAQKQEDTALAFRDELKQRDESLAQATTALHQARARLEEAMGLASARGEALNEALPKLARAEDLWRGCRAKLQIAEAAAKEYQDANAKRYNDAIKALDRRAKEAARADQVRWKSERARVEAETAASTAQSQIKLRTAVMGLIAILAFVVGVLGGALIFGGRAGAEAVGNFEGDIAMDVGRVRVADIPLSLPNVTAVVNAATATAPPPAAAAAAAAAASSAVVDAKRREAKTECRVDKLKGELKKRLLERTAAKPAEDGSYQKQHSGSSTTTAAKPTKAVLFPGPPGAAGAAAAEENKKEAVIVQPVVQSSKKKMLLLRRRRRRQRRRRQLQYSVSY